MSAIILGMAATIASPTAISAAESELKSFLADRVSASESQREQHSHGEDTHPPGLPDLVCFPQTTEEVSQIARISAKYGLPIVPFGAGSSLEGQVNAIRGGISI